MLQEINKICCVFTNMKKRGVSEVIITVIMVGLVLVAIGVVWYVINNIIQQGSEKISVNALEINLELKSVKIEDGNLDLMVRRGAGQGSFSKLNIIVSDETNSQIFEKDASDLEELETKKFTITPSELTSVGFAKSVEIAPVFKQGSREKEGNVIDSYEDPSITVDSEGWILIWQGLPTQAIYLSEEGEKININKPIKFNKIKFQGANINHYLIDTTSEPAILMKTIPEYFKDVDDEPDSSNPRVKFHDLNGNKDVTLTNNYFMYGYGNEWRFMWACADVRIGDPEMFIGEGSGGCPPRTSFDAADVGCFWDSYNYCSEVLDNSLKDSGLGLSIREYQEAKVWVKFN